MVALFLMAATLAQTVSISTPSTVTAGEDISITATASGGTAPYKYSWAVLTAPTGATLAARTQATASIPSALAGPYVLAITVTDAAGAAATARQSFTTFRAAGNGVVSSDPVLGSVASTSYDVWTRLTSQRQAALMTNTTFWTRPGTGRSIAEFDTLAAGTISLSGTGLRTVTGTGTAFASCPRGIMIRRPLPSGGFGWQPFSITCSSATSATLGADWLYPSTTTGLAFAMPTNDLANDFGHLQEGWNYYDAVVSLYREYWRTGDTAYRDRARTVADEWAKFGLSLAEGRVWDINVGFAPRQMSAMGVFMRALDGRPELFPLLGALNDYCYNLWWTLQAADVRQGREQGYVLMFAALEAKYSPDASRRATAASRVDAMMTWMAARTKPWRWYDSGTDGLGWMSPACPSESCKSHDLLMGGIWQEALVLVHQALGDARALTMIQEWVTWVETFMVDDRNLGTSPAATCRAVFYIASWLDASPSTQNVDGGCTAAASGLATPLEWAANNRSLTPLMLAPYAYLNSRSGTEGNYSDRIKFWMSAAYAADGEGPTPPSGVAGRWKGDQAQKYPLPINANDRKASKDSWQSRTATTAVWSLIDSTTRGIPATSRAVSVRFTLPAAGWSASIEYRRADGTTGSVACASSPCSATVDQALGNILYRMVYTASGSRSTSGAWSRL